MIIIYGMDTCPDCAAVKEQIQGRETEFEYRDIGSHIRILKEFLHLRDTDGAFREAKENGLAGVPCFVLENGQVSLKEEDAGLISAGAMGGASCSLEDHRNGKKGC